MYFETSEIKNVRRHIADHAKEIGLELLEDDYQLYTKAIESIIEFQGRKYEEGEQLNGDHYDALKDWVKKAVMNSADIVIYDARKGRLPQKPINDPADYLLTVTDYYYTTAMQKLG